MSAFRHYISRLKIQIILVGTTILIKNISNDKNLIVFLKYWVEAESKTRHYNDLLSRAMNRTNMFEDSNITFIAFVRVESDCSIFTNQSKVVTIRIIPIKDDKDTNMSKLAFRDFVQAENGNTLFAF